MHELGIVYEVIKIVDNFVVENQLTEVEKIVLEVGQLSQAIPRFLEECYPAAVDGTPYETTVLEIVQLPAIGECQACGREYNIIENRKVCPSCGKDDFELLTGQEFNIKEVVAR